MDKKMKKKVLEVVYNYLKERGYENFKADLLDTDNPKKIVEKGAGNIFKPDMTATHNENDYIFELEMGNSFDNDKERFIKKCKAFQQYAAEHNGKLYLIVPIEHFDAILTNVNKYNLENIGILQLQTS